MCVDCVKKKKLFAIVRIPSNPLSLDILALSIDWTLSTARTLGNCLSGKGLSRKSELISNDLIRIISSHTD